MSQQLDREVVNHHALVVDANPTTRSVLVQQLREFGFGNVKQASRTIEARDALENRRYDLVVCDLHFDNGSASGQELLDELRREQMLPYSTVFVMVTGEATYARVAEAAEAALDSYLVKPFSANALFERVKEARQRKRALREVFEAIEAGRIDDAAAMCIERFIHRQQYWLFAARVGAELLLNQRRTVEAKQLYEAVIAAKSVPWARLGVARVQLVDNDLGAAKRSLDALISEMPHYADLYDVMGKVQMEGGHLADALATYRTAADLTPACILRLQHCGTLNFYIGDARQGIDMLERTWALGHKSRLYDALSMMLLAFLKFDAKDSRGLAQAYEALERFRAKHPDSRRLTRMTGICEALTRILEGKVGTAIQLAREALVEAAQPSYDMEAATNTLALWSRLALHGIETPEYAQVVRQVARRFCISKATTEVLAATVRLQPEAVEWVREANAEVMRVAEQAMNLALTGQPKVAVAGLLRHGGENGNAKLIELAGLVAQRHRERIDEVEPMLASAGELAKRYCTPHTHLAGVRRSNRSAGGLVLRR